jgi:hypothetical protein
MYVRTGYVSRCQGLWPALVQRQDGGNDVAYVSHLSRLQSHIYTQTDSRAGVTFWLEQL